MYNKIDLFEIRERGAFGSPYFILRFDEGRDTFILSDLTKTAGDKEVSLYGAMSLNIQMGVKFEPKYEECNENPVKLLEMFTPPLICTLDRCVVVNMPQDVEQYMFDILMTHAKIFADDSNVEYILALKRGKINIIGTGDNVEKLVSGVTTLGDSGSPAYCFGLECRKIIDGRYPHDVYGGEYFSGTFEGLYFEYLTDNRCSDASYKNKAYSGCPAIIIPWEFDKIKWKA